MSLFGPFVVVAVVSSTPLTLEEVRAASKQNLEAVKAELDAARAHESVRVARSAILPQLNLTLSAGETFASAQRTFGSFGAFAKEAVDTPAYNQGAFSLSLSLTQLLYDGGRWWNQIAQSGAHEEAMKGQLAEQQLASEFEAVRRFYELVKAQLQLEVLEATVARSREQVTRAQSLFDAGRGGRSAVFDAMTNVTNDQINVARQRQRISAARLGLLQWLGRSEEAIEAVSPAALTAPSPAPDLERALEMARSQRPLVQSLAQSVRAAELGVSLGWANYLPTLSASASYGRDAPAADAFFTDLTRQNRLQVGAMLRMNLFAGLAHDAQLRQARLEARRAHAQEHQSLVDLEAELRRTHEALRVELEVLEMNEASQATAQQQLSLEEQRFAAGAASSLEVRNAQIKYTHAQLAVLAGRADVAVARAALERSIGGAIP